jgi:AAA15 family ATPase/GTPase
MLLRITIANFLSIAEEIEFSLFAQGSLRKMRDHLYATPAVDLLKAGALYGANGSGKSTFVKAMTHLHAFVTNQAFDTAEFPIEPFKLRDDLLQKPSQFGVEFFTGKHYYQYELVMSGYLVEEESLYQTHPEGGEPELIFSRRRSDGKIEVDFHPDLVATDKDATRASIYVDELLTSTGSLLNLLATADVYPVIDEVYEWFEQKFIVIRPDSVIKNLSEHLYDDPEFVVFANQLLGILDTGVEEIGLYGTTYETYFGQDEPHIRRQLMAELSDGQAYTTVTVRGEVMLAKMRGSKLMIFRVATHHRGQDGKLMMFFPGDESDGTRRVLDFLPTWALLMKKDVTVVIDEIGRSLHPNLLEQLLKLFMTSDTRGQLIFTTHEDSLLSQDLFRRDEIWFMEKTKMGNTTIYPLSDFKIRQDLDIRKHYLFGRFGGTPRLNQVFLEDLKTV